VGLSFVEAALAEIKVCTYLAVVAWTFQWLHSTCVAPRREGGRDEGGMKEGGWGDEGREGGRGGRRGMEGG